MMPISAPRRLAFSLLALLTLTSLTFGQQSRMNAFGHFPDAKTRPQALSRTSEPGLDTLNLIGTSIFRSINGFITIDG